jgi:hypothetical protein
VGHVQQRLLQEIHRTGIANDSPSRDKRIHCPLYAEIEAALEECQGRIAGPRGFAALCASLNCSSRRKAGAHHKIDLCALADCC